MTPRLLKRVGGGVLALALVAVLAFGAYNRDLLRSATGSVSHALCAAAFIEGLDPDQVYREEQLPEGMRPIDWALRYEIDRTQREVRTRVAGLFASRAVFREGYGCVIVHEGEPPQDVKITPVAAAPTAQTALVEPEDPAVRDALAAAFAEPDPAAPRFTKAIAVMYRGRLIGERYAPGYGPDTPLWGHSLTKSLTSALIGVLVRQGKLQTAEPVPIDAWRSAGDARRTVTVDQLLRMSSGLPFDENYDHVTLAMRMWFLERDMAAFAASTPLVHAPGTAWGYSNLGFTVLARLVRDAAGSGPADAQAFARRELFEPLGMRTAMIDLDATGTPLGAGQAYASARDWARLGQLYLDDGQVGGRRILPEGWVAYSASQTLDTGYGAGFWTNLVNEGSVPIWDAPWGMPQLPKDMFYARGYMGQYIVIVPSEHLVVTRFGYAHGGPTGIGDTIAKIIAALHARSPAVTQ